jgi:hypothetical protein
VKRGWLRATEWEEKWVKTLGYLLAVRLDEVTVGYWAAHLGDTMVVLLVDSKARLKVDMLGDRLVYPLAVWWVAKMVYSTAVKKVESSVGLSDDSLVDMTAVRLVLSSADSKAVSLVY